MVCNCELCKRTECLPVVPWENDSDGKPARLLVFAPQPTRFHAVCLVVFAWDFDHHQHSGDNHHCTHPLDWGIVMSNRPQHLFILLAALGLGTLCHGASPSSLMPQTNEVEYLLISDFTEALSDVDKPDYSELNEKERSLESNRSLQANFNAMGQKGWRLVQTGRGLTIFMREK